MISQAVSIQSSHAHVPAGSKCKQHAFAGCEHTNEPCACDTVLKKTGDQIFGVTGRA